MPGIMPNDRWDGTEAEFIAASVSESLIVSSHGRGRATWARVIMSANFFHRLRDRVFLPAILS